jgi:hypothetical protein
MGRMKKESNIEEEIKKDAKGERGKKERISERRKKTSK